MFLVNAHLASVLNSLQRQKQRQERGSPKYNACLSILKSLLDHNEDLCYEAIPFSDTEKMHPIDFALKYNLQDVVELIKPYMMMPSLKKISGKQVLYNILQQEDVEMQKKYLSILPTEMLEYLKREINKEITTLHYKPYNYNYSQQLKNLKSLIDQIAY